jgi:hypothetical protein
MRDRGALLAHGRDRRLEDAVEGAAPPAAWAAPTTRASASAKSTGAQSAVRMPSATPGARVTMASTFGDSSRGQGRSTSATRMLWV